MFDLMASSGGEAGDPTAPSGGPDEDSGRKNVAVEGGGEGPEGVRTVREGDAVLLLEPDGDLHLVEARGEVRKVPGLGVLDPSNLLGHPWGLPLRVGQRDVTPLPPLPVDRMRTAERGPQIIQPKDAARILLECGIRPGARVLEVGSGSGVLTLALAFAVGGDGRILSLDHRKEHQETARSNVERAGVAERVAFVVGKAEDPPEALALAVEADGPFDALVTDVPNPDEAVPALGDHVRVGGAAAIYVPLISQVEAVHRVLHGGPWTRVRTVELIERSWHVGSRGSRPEFDMLGHTGFLTFARRAALGAPRGEAVETD